MAKITGDTIAAPRIGKDWSWSYSKLKNFEECPKKHYEVDIAKSHVETQSDDPDSALNWGNRVHDAFKHTLINPPHKMPPEMAAYQGWVDRVRAGPGQLLVEQKYAINRDFQKTAYFAPDAWYRGIGDVVRLDSDLALVLDWKTGKIVEDSVQLMLMAQCLFSHYPQLKYVRSEFVWLKFDAQTPELFTRQEVANQWVHLMERVNALENASKTLTYPPKPGRLCKSYCPVASCPFWKKGAK
jgi:hypothetical protein